MSPLDLFWHVLNGLAPALGLALLVPALAKLVWRRRLRRAPFGRLFFWTLAAAVAATALNLLLLDRDGRMLGYGILVLATALALWWAAFGAASSRRR